MHQILKYGSFVNLLIATLILYFIGSVNILFNPYANIIFIAIIILNIVCYTRKKILLADALLGWWGQFLYGMPLATFFAVLAERKHSVYWIEWVVIMLFSICTASSILLFVISLSELVKAKSFSKRSRYIFRIITFVGILPMILYYVDRSVTTAINDFYFPKQKLR